MTTPSHPILAETVAAIGFLTQTTVTYALLALAPAERYATLDWTLLTFLGATGAALVCFCLNTRAEIRRAIIGRCLVAMLIGVVGSRGLAIIHPAVMQVLDDPIMRIGAGAVFGFIGWIFFAAIFRRAQEREENIAKLVVQAGEARLAQQVAGLVAKEAAVVAEPLAAKVEAVASALQVSPAPQQLDVTIRQVETTNK